jgi:hypothetical protein
MHAAGMQVSEKDLNEASRCLPSVATRLSTRYPPHYVHPKREGSCLNLQGFFFGFFGGGIIEDYVDLHLNRIVTQLTIIWAVGALFGLLGCDTLLN